LVQHASKWIEFQAAACAPIAKMRAKREQYLDEAARAGGGSAGATYTTSTGDAKTLQAIVRNQGEIMRLLTPEPPVAEQTFPPQHPTPPASAPPLTPLTLDDSTPTGGEIKRVAAELKTLQSLGSFKAFFKYWTNFKRGQESFKDLERKGGGAAKYRAGKSNTPTVRKAASRLREVYSAIAYRALYREGSDAPLALHRQFPAVTENTAADEFDMRFTAAKDAASVAEAKVPTLNSFWLAEFAKLKKEKAWDSFQKTHNHSYNANVGPIRRVARQEGGVHEGEGDGHEGGVQPDAV
jgi:hypothetical protein